jgi:hypothetical protein
MLNTLSIFNRVYVNLNGLRAKKYEYGNVFVHKDLKGSLTRDFWGKLILEKNLKLKISCQTPFKGL